MESKRIVLAISGASGVIYGIEAARYILKNSDVELHCIISQAAQDIMEQELNFNSLESALADVANLADAGDLANVGNAGDLGDVAQSDRLKIHDNKDFFSEVASGSFAFDAMLISPCSANTLGKLAYGVADNLITRAASVALKERRKLCLVLRETPLSLPILQSATTLSQAGATIMPACPAFYSGEKTFEDLIKFVVGKSLSAIGIKQSLIKEWNGKDTL